MIGANRGSQGDSVHPFDVSEYVNTYSIDWLDQVSEKEKVGSTLYYEQLKAIDELCKKNGISASDVHFVFGRGTIGRSSERELAEGLRKAVKQSGKDAFKVILAKSFGVVDTLRALKILGKRAEDTIGRINVLFCVDGYAPLFSRRSVSKKYNVGNKKESRLVVPSCVDRVYGVVQRAERYRGLKAGKPGDPRITNFVVRQSHVDGSCRIYDHYSDGYVRVLEVNHPNMDEIVSVVPCCKESKDTRYTFPEIILREYESKG
jgi:hypothetical protein